MSKTSSLAAPHLVDIPRAKRVFSRGGMRVLGMHDDALVSIYEIASDLGVSVRTVHRLRKEGLPFSQHKRGGALRFDPKAVREWMQAAGTRSAASGSNR